jgi:peptidoglycan hydrolase-like protein with peptidoglycan-binding domain
MAGGGRAGAGAAASAPTYETGAQGEDVRVLQQLLANWGFNPGKIDGQFGNATTIALRAYQQYMGIPVTGQATGNTIQYLQSDTLFRAIKVEGTLAPGQPLPKSVALGSPRVDAASLQAIVPPPPAQSAAPPPAAATGGGGGRGGNVTIVQPGPTGPPAPSFPKTDAEADKWIREKYGSYAWMLDDPSFAEVRDQLRLAAKEGWDEQATLSKVKETNWFKSNSDDARAWEIKKKTDPGAAGAQLAKNKNELKTMATRMGVELSEADADRMAEDYAKNNWQPMHIQQAIAGHAVYKPDFGGDIGAYETQIKATARDYLMPISDEDAWKMAQKKAKGELTDEGVSQNFKEQAIGLLPSLKKYIDEGQVPRQLLAGHIQDIANLLEIEPDQVDFASNSKFVNVISHVDEKGQPRIMTRGETSKYIKGLDEYYQTTNAQNETGQYMSALKQTFGMG